MKSVKINYKAYVRLNIQSDGIGLKVFDFENVRIFEYFANTFSQVTFSSYFRKNEQVNGWSVKQINRLMRSQGLPGISNRLKKIEKRFSVVKMYE